jgi:L-alanine-DL-glutamate epimerase-like enolase superfamily enzyme
MHITGVRTVTCSIALPNPIVMGELRFDAREYIVVIVETDAGIAGVGFGMTRGAPVAAIVERNLAPLLIGRDPFLTEALNARLVDRNLMIAGRGIFARALSAVDIALWDIKGQALGQPIWRLLGGARERIPVAVAGGYADPARSLDDLAAEVAGYADRGIGLIKIAADSLANDSARIAAASEALGDRGALAFDAHWAWRRTYDVLPVVRGWAPFGLAFIEDPFAPELTALAVELRAATGIPIALGEEAVGRWAFASLLADQQPDVLRLDATSMGGLSEAVKVVALASVRARPVFPHVFPEIHVHLAAAFSEVMAVELTMPEMGLESLYRLFGDWVLVEGGEIVAPSRPGLGLTLDEDAVARYAIGSTYCTEAAIGDCAAAGQASPGLPVRRRRASGSDWRR